MFIYVFKSIAVVFLDLFYVFVPIHVFFLDHG